MKKLFSFIIFISIMSPYTFSQDTPYIFQKVKDANGTELLLGKCSRNALLDAPFASWFKSAYDTYTVDSATCQSIAPLLKEKKIHIFMGTWCGDSRREVPRILKMLDCCGFPPEQVKLIMVGNQPPLYKQSPSHEEVGRNILRVPTIIIEASGTEKGRVVESPVVSLEKDILSILRSEGYVPNYSEKGQGK